jgi:hypothetical protein
MKKAILPAVAVLFCFCGLAMGEPFFTESAVNVLPLHALELGFMPVTNVSYDSTVADIHGNSIPGAVTAVNTVPLFARYAVSPDTEFYMSLYEISRQVNDNTGSVPRTVTQSGMDDPMVGARYTFFDDSRDSGWAFAGGFFAALPLGDSTFRKGFDLSPLLAARKKVNNYFVNLNLFYDITGAYNNENTLKSDPGDVLELDGEIEYPSMLFGKAVELSAGMMAQSISNALVAGSNVASTNRLNAIVGIRRDIGRFKTKLGFDKSIGNSDQRLYDYKIIAGITYLVGV